MVPSQQRPNATFTFLVSKYYIFIACNSQGYLVGKNNVNMNPGYQHRPHDTIRYNEDGLVSKKRKASSSNKEKAKEKVRIVCTDSVTTVGTSATGEVSILTLVYSS